MARQHHQLNGHKFEQTLGNSEGQGSLACLSPWGCRVGLHFATKQLSLYNYTYSLLFEMCYVLNSVRLKFIEATTRNNSESLYLRVGPFKEMIKLK